MAFDAASRRLAKLGFGGGQRAAAHLPGKQRRPRLRQRLIPAAGARARAETAFNQPPSKKKGKPEQTRSSRIENVPVVSQVGGGVSGGSTVKKLYGTCRDCGSMAEGDIDVGDGLFYCNVCWINFTGA